MLGILVVLACGFFSPPKAYPQFYDLELQVGDTVGYSGKENSRISVYMKNYSDTVEGFSFWIRLDKPDVAYFQSNVDTLIDTIYWTCMNYFDSICIDSTNVSDSVSINPAYEFDWFTVDSFLNMIGHIDTTNTRISGWQVITARSLIGQPYDLFIQAWSDWPTPPQGPHGIGPQYGITPLFRLIADVKALTNCDSVRTVNIDIVDNFNHLQWFYFYDNGGDPIGIIGDSTVDTIWLICNSWQQNQCQEWVVLPDSLSSVADSFTVLWDEFSRLDTSSVYIDGGSLTALKPSCGDVNINGTVNIIDVTYLNGYLYAGGPPPPLPSVADVSSNSDNLLNILDVTRLLDYLYKGGAPLACDCLPVY